MRRHCAFQPHAVRRDELERTGRSTRVCSQAAQTASTAARATTPASPPATTVLAAPLLPLAEACAEPADDALEAALEADDVSDSSAEVALAATEDATDERVELLSRSRVGSVSVQKEVKPAEGWRSGSMRCGRREVTGGVTAYSVRLRWRRHRTKVRKR